MTGPIVAMSKHVRDHAGELMCWRAMAHKAKDPSVYLERLLVSYDMLKAAQAQVLMDSLGRGTT